jgi:hypothetical protein
MVGLLVWAHRLDDGSWDSGHEVHQVLCLTAESIDGAPHFGAVVLEPELGLVELEDLQTDNALTELIVASWPSAEDEDHLRPIVHRLRNELFMRRFPRPAAEASA